MNVAINCTIIFFLFFFAKEKKIILINRENKRNECNAFVNLAYSYIYVLYSFSAWRVYVVIFYFSTVQHGRDGTAQRQHDKFRAFRWYILRLTNLCGAHLVKLSGSLWDNIYTILKLLPEFGTKCFFGFLFNDILWTQFVWTTINHSLHTHTTQSSQQR